MIKSFKYTAMLVGLGCVTAFSSCSDFLDKEPDERVNLVTEDQVVSFLTGSYPEVNYTLMAELSSDNIVDNNSPHKSIDPNIDRDDIYYNLPSYDRMDDELFAFEPVKSSTGNDSPSMVWQGFYKSIASANFALERIDQMQAENGGKLSETLSAAKGEALLLRAYGHFVLVNLFSQAYKNDEASLSDLGIPYTTVPETTVNPSYDRSNVTETYKKIEADLIEGMKLISNINYKKIKWHFNVDAANAFAARFYLYKRDYAKVIEHVNAVLGENTDDETLLSKMQRYDGFEGCTMQSDYANIYQHPDNPNNIMLLATYSGFSRHFAGCRYGHAGEALKQTVYRGGPTWAWTVLPAGMVGGWMFTYGGLEYGLLPSKAAETFQYVDKIAGTGYAHVIRREFTNTELILMRAEAKLLGNNDKDGCFADLRIYNNSLQTFNEKDKAYYGKNNGIRDLDKETLEFYYSKTFNPNVFEDWSFTQNMSADFVVAEDQIPYMNCINDFRRMETLFEGLRFFDLKRWGIEYTHVIGKDKVVQKLTWNDPRRALELPLEVLSAGLQASRPINAAGYSMISKELVKPVTNK